VEREKKDGEGERDGRKRREKEKREKGGERGRGRGREKGKTNPPKRAGKILRHGKGGKEKVCKQEMSECL